MQNDYIIITLADDDEDDRLFFTDAFDELKINTVAVYTFEDRYSLHRYKADQSFQIGDESEPLKPYLDIEEIIREKLVKNLVKYPLKK